jgi:hypothetical protein
MKKVSTLTITLAALAIIICGVVYVAGQQILRQGANDPQIQFAEDAASRLSRGDPVTVNGFGQVDVASSLSPFMITYDDKGVVTQTSAVLHDASPEIPSGVLDYAKAHHEDRLTWQPERGVRIATVAVYYSGTNSGYVVVGRNLGEVEKREDQLAMEVAAALVACLVIITAYAIMPKSAKS